jgi:hypothetical protein
MVSRAASLTAPLSQPCCSCRVIEVMVALRLSIGHHPSIVMAFRRRLEVLVRFRILHPWRTHLALEDTIDPVVLPVVENFETSKLRFEYEAIFEEFRTLRDEIRTRIEKQQEITNFSIAFMAALLIATSQLLPKSELLKRFTPFYPIISLLLAAFTLMTLDHEMNILHLYTYLDQKLQPRMNRIVSSAAAGAASVWEWNRYRASWQQHAGRVGVLLTSPMAGSKYGLTIIPNGFIAGYMAFYGLTRHLPGWEVLEYLLPGAGWLFTVFVGLYISYSYFRLEHA